MNEFTNEEFAGEKGDRPRTLASAREFERIFGRAAEGPARYSGPLLRSRVMQ
jgi:hypothetical protein